MTTATAAVLALLLQMYPVSGLPQGLSRPAAIKSGSTGAPSTTASLTAAANKSLLLVVNQHSKPNLIININNNYNNNNGPPGGGGVVIGGGGIQICGNTHGCSWPATKGTATRGPTTTPTASSATASTSTRGPTTTPTASSATASTSTRGPTTTPTASSATASTSASTAAGTTTAGTTAAASTRATTSTTSGVPSAATASTKTAEATTTAASTTKGSSGYLLIANHASSNVIILEPPDRADDSRGAGITTRRPLPPALVTSAVDDEDARAAATTGAASTGSGAKHSTASTARHKEEDAKAGVTRSTATALAETSTRHSTSTAAVHKVVAGADGDDVKAGAIKSTAGTTPAGTRPVRHQVEASAAGGCHTVMEEAEGEDGAATVSARTKLPEACHVLVKSEEASEEEAARKHVPRAAAVVNVRVVAQAVGCEVSVKPVAAAEDGHEDVKAKRLRTKAVDVRVVASAGGCNLEVKSEAGTAHAALEATTSRPSPRPPSRAHTMHLAVLPQPAGGCHVHLRPDDTASHQDDMEHPKHGAVGVHITPYRSGAGCRVELASGRGSTARAPSNKAAKTTTAMTASTRTAVKTSAGKASLPASGHGDALADDDAVVPLDPDDIAERTGVLAALGQTFRAFKYTVMGGAESAGGVVASATRRAAKGLRVVMDIEISSTTAATTAATTAGASTEAAA